MSRLEPPDIEPTPDIPGYKAVAPEDRPYVVLLIGPRADGDVVGPLMGSYPPQSIQVLVWVRPDVPGPEMAVMSEIIRDLRSCGFQPSEVRELPKDAPIIGVHSFDFPDNASISFLAEYAVENEIEGRRWSQGTCTGVFGGASK